jgi:hypothetical protein
LRAEGYEDHEPKKIEAVPTNKIFYIIWLLLEHPYSSVLGRILSISTFIFTTLYVIIFCTVTLTLPCSNSKSGCTIKTLYKDEIEIFEKLFNIWFSTELLLRFMVAPLKINFIRNLGNIFDFLSILSFFLELTNIKYGFVLWFQILRIFRIFRLAKLFHAFTDLLNYDKIEKLLNELGIPVMFMLIGVILFSSFVYYSEIDSQDTKFKLVHI